MGAQGHGQPAQVFDGGTTAKSGVAVGLPSVSGAARCGKGGVRDGPWGCTLIYSALLTSQPRLVAVGSRGLPQASYSTVDGCRAVPMRCEAF